MVEGLKGKGVECVRQSLPAGNRRRDDRLQTLEPDGEKAPFSGQPLVDEEIRPVGLHGKGCDIAPVKGGRDAFDLRRRPSGCVQPSDHRADAGGGNEVDGDLVPDEALQHADLGDTPGTPSAKYQADLRSPDHPLGNPGVPVYTCRVESGRDDKPFGSGGPGSGNAQRQGGK